MQRLSLLMFFLFAFAVAMAQTPSKVFWTDFGPDDVTNGNITNSPDANGNYWNNIINEAPAALPVNFVDSENNPTGVSLSIISEFFKNGILNGGLLNPDPALLGEFAIPTATQDYFYQTTAGSFKLSGLNTSKAYIFHFFATRNSESERITQYTLQGSSQTSVTLQSSGVDLGGTGYNGNNSSIAITERIEPDVNGEIIVAVSQIAGGFCYIGIMKIEEIDQSPHVESTGVLIDFGPNDITNGNITINPDSNGNYWNNAVQETPTADTLFLVDNANMPTNFYMTVLSAFGKNGILNGGLLNPDPVLLGDFAIPTATQDYFFSTTSGSIEIGGLDISKAYVFRFFGTRDSPSDRITKYRLTGSSIDSITLQTSGVDLGGPGYNGNIQTIAVTNQVRPDANGKIKINLSVVTGGFCYLGEMKMEEVEVIIPVESTGMLIDFGPNDIINGNNTVSPDLNGNYWNNVNNGMVGGDPVSFVDNANNPTGAYLTVTAQFSTNGILNGGLLEPDSALLGEFAIATATQDYFFQTTSSAFKISGLDNTRSYIFHFFGTRNSAEQRITEYKVEGANTSTINLQTSGTDLGGPGYNGNNSTVVNSAPVVPNGNGDVSVTVTTLAGTYCYLGAMKIEPVDTILNITIENGGFETGDLSSWEIDPQGNLASALVTNVKSHSGDYALNLSGDSVKLFQVLNCQPNVDFLLTGYFYNDSGNPLEEGQSTFLIIKYFDDNMNLLSTTKSNAITYSSPTNEWIKVAALATVSENASFLEVVIEWDGLVNQLGGSVYVDDLKLEVYDAVVSACTAYPQFMDEQNTSSYMQPGFEDGYWFTIDLPSDTGKVLSDNKTYWFRKTINVSQALADDSLFVLKPGIIYGADAIWFNGELIGESGFQNGVRNYVVPDSLVLLGENVVVIHTGFIRGSLFFDDNFNMQLYSFVNPGNSLSVSGDWKYLQGIIFNNDNIVNEQNHIVVMGSSVALGQGAASSYGYAAQYTDLLGSRFNRGGGADWDVVNISIGGNITTDLLNRFESDLIPQCAQYVMYGLSLGNEGIHENSQQAFDQFRDNMLQLIQQAREYNIVPVIVNCYPRSDFNLTDYNFLKQMNLLINSWDVPSINMLGSIDDGSGRWVEGFYADGWHPNTWGHLEMMTAIVPSLFDALDQGKPLPEKVEGASYKIINPTTITPLEYETDEIVHPFTFSFDVKTSQSGGIAAFSTSTGNGLIKIDDTDGSVVYISPGGTEIRSTFSITDNNWHKIILSHYYAREATFFYVDTINIGSVTERLLLDKVVLGGSGYFNEISAPGAAEYRDWLFYRSAINEDEVQALNSGELLKSSLELYAPLDEQGLTGSDPFVNLAQSTTKVVQHLISGLNNELDNIPKEFGLFNNYPNPFNPTTIIRYAIAKTSHVELEVFNILGQKVATLVNADQMPGYYEVSFGGISMASGVYFYLLSADSFKEVKKMILIK